MTVPMSQDRDEEQKNVRFAPPQDSQTEDTAAQKPPRSPPSTISDIPRSALRTAPPRSTSSRSILGNGLSHQRSASPVSERRSPSPTVRPLVSVPVHGRRATATLSYGDHIHNMNEPASTDETNRRQWSGPVDDEVVSVMTMQEFHAVRARFRWPAGRGNIEATYCDFGQASRDNDFPLKDRQEIGCTSNCTIYSCVINEAEHGFSDRVAVKTLKVVPGKKSQRLWQRERDNLKDLMHVHVVGLLGTFRHKSRVALVMYPVAKYDLHHFLQLAGRSDQTTTQRISRRRLLRTFLPCLCSALQYLHVHNLKHRDIKPGNILIDRHSSLLIADFGISSKFDKPSDMETSGPRTNQTVRYAAPEVLRKGSRGPAADIFCLGCVFLEIIAVLCGHTVEKLEEHVAYEVPLLEDEESDEDTVEKEDGSKVRRVVKFGDRKSAPKVKRFIEISKTALLSRPRTCRYDLADDHFDKLEQMLDDNPAIRPNLTELFRLFRVNGQTCDCHAQVLEPVNGALSPITEQPAEESRQHESKSLTQSDSTVESVLRSTPLKGSTPSTPASSAARRVPRDLAVYDLYTQEVSYCHSDQIRGKHIMVYDAKQKAPQHQVYSVKRDDLDWNDVGYFMQLPQDRGRTLETHDKMIQLPWYNSALLKSRLIDTMYIFVRGTFSKEELEKGRRG